MRNGRNMCSHVFRKSGNIYYIRAPVYQYLADLNFNVI